MISNATLSGWKKRSGADAEGAPTWTAVAGEWKCCSEIGGRRFLTDPAGRAIPVDRVVRTDAVLAIAAGDKVSVDGVEYLVLSSGVQPGALQHLRLELGSAA